MLQLLKERNFLIFYLGHVVSVIGDHVTLIAFPWLVLQMTGSPAMTGLVFAVQGIPRAILMLGGGAAVDRFSPRKVMLAAHMVRMVIVALASWLIYADMATLVQVFVLAAAFGVADAFVFPASNAILPSLVKKDDLTPGNALVQMATQVAIIFGPVIAGFVIAGEITFNHVAGEGTGSSYADDRIGLARTFAVDAATFALSILSLLLIRVRSLHDEAEGEDASILSGIMDAVRFAWGIPGVRLAFLGIAVLEFFYQAPIFVALPVLAKARFAEGAAVYGLEIAAYGVGAVIGGLMGGLLPSPPRRWFVPVMFVIFAYSGAALGLIVLWEPYQWAMALFFVAGVGDNYIWVHFVALLQRVTPDHLMGRVMSIFMLLAIGLLPIANAVIGFLVEWDVETVLMVVSAIMVVSCLVCAAHPHARILPRDAELVGAPLDDSADQTA